MRVSRSRAAAKWSSTPPRPGPPAGRPQPVGAAERSKELGCHQVETGERLDLREQDLRGSPVRQPDGRLGEQGERTGPGHRIAQAASPGSIAAMQGGAGPVDHSEFAVESPPPPAPRRWRESGRPRAPRERTPGPRSPDAGRRTAGSTARPCPPSGTRTKRPIGEWLPVIRLSRRSRSSAGAASPPSGPRATARTGHG